MGLRKFIGWDYPNYYSFFEEVKSLTDQGNAIHFNEIGFVAYTVFIKKIFSSYFIWVFTSTLIDVMLIDCILRKHSNYYVLGFVFFFVFSSALFIDVMRNSKSILLFMVSLQYIKKRRIIPYMLLNCCGILFHMSAVLYLPLYFVLYKNCSKTMLIVVFLLGNIIFLLKIDFIKPIALFIANMLAGGHFAGYINLYYNSVSAYVHYGISLGYLERTMTFLLIIIFYKKLATYKTNVVVINIYILYFICFTFLASANIVSSRMALLFKAAYWILYPNIFMFLRGKANKGIFLMILSLYSLVAVTSTYRSILFKYDNVLFLSDRSFSDSLQTNLAARKFVEK
jgi:hypothetical protein